MNKQEFLKALKYRLRKLKKQERNRYLEYYDEIISDITESGVSEEDAIERQGSVEQIARDILANTNPANLRTVDWRGIALSAVSLILLLSCIIPLLLKMRLNMTTSFGVIGGADGPTAIFVAGKIGAPWGLYIATAVAVITTIIYLVKKHRKR